MYSDYYTQPNHAPRSTDPIPFDTRELVLKQLQERFNEYTIEDILFSIKQSVQQERYQREQQSYQTPPPSPRVAPPRTRRTNDLMDPAELREIGPIGDMNRTKQLKVEEIREVANYFIGTGYNYGGIRFLLPKVSPAQLRSYLDTINNKTIDEIQKSLRCEFGVQVQHLSQEQRIALKRELLHVREWLGPKKTRQLQTYHKFIARHYLDRPEQISFAETRDLYSTMLQYVRSPFVDIAALNEETYHASMAVLQTQGGYTKGEEKAVVEQYLEHHNLPRISSKMMRHKGVHKKWRVPGIVNLLRDAICSTLQKVVRTRNKYLVSMPVWFEAGTMQAKMLFDSSEDGLKNLLLRFYIANQVTFTGLARIIKSLNHFFKSQPEDQVIDLEELSEIPKQEFVPKQEASIVSQASYGQNEEEESLQPLAMEREKEEFDRQTAISAEEEPGQEELLPVAQAPASTSPSQAEPSTPKSK